MKILQLLNVIAMGLAPFKRKERGYSKALHQV